MRGSDLFSLLSPKLNRVLSDVNNMLKAPELGFTAVKEETQMML